MDRVRSVLEVLKFTSPRDALLCAATASSLWRRCSDLDELWLTHCEAEGIDFNCEGDFPAKELYHQHARQATSLLFVLGNTLSIITVSDLVVTTITLNSDTGVTCKNGYCFVKPFTVVCFGTGEQPNVRKINIKRLEVSALPSMTVGRIYPGLMPYSSYVYVFGGRTTNCEKLNLRTSQWEPILASLASSIEGTQPVRFNLDVFLLSQSRIEVFSLTSETFSPLRLSLPLEWYYSLALIHDCSLVVVQRDVVGRWEIEASPRRFQAAKLEWPLGCGYYSNCPTVWHDGKCFSLHNDIPRVRGVLCFSPQSNSLERVLGLMDPNYLDA